MRHWGEGGAERGDAWAGVWGGVGRGEWTGSPSPHLVGETRYDYTHG